MPERQPDIEIYLKRVPIDDMIDWLQTHFVVVDKTRTGDSHQLSLTYAGTPLSCMIVEKAVKGGYASLWFKTNATPWTTDEDCARDAFDYFGAETRCSIGGWVPSSPDPDSQSADSTDLHSSDLHSSEKGGWYRFTEAGQSIVNWLT